MQTAPSMTLADIKNRVALRAQKIVQDSAGKIVADTMEPAADLIEKAVYDGIQAFWLEHDWAFASQFVQFNLDPDGTGPLNIDGDAGRYLLPEYVQSVPLARVLLRYPNSGGCIPLQTLHMDQVVARQFTEPDIEGTPTDCAVEWNHANAPGMSQRGAFELRVFPKPSQAFTVGFRARTGPVPMVNDTQRGNWPGAHDAAVVACAVVELMRHDQKPDSPARKVAEMEKAAQIELSKRHDDLYYRPASLGPVGSSGWPSGRLATLTDQATGNTIMSVTVFD